MPMVPFDWQGVDSYKRSKVIFGLGGTVVELSAEAKNKNVERRGVFLRQPLSLRDAANGNE